MCRRKEFSNPNSNKKTTKRLERVLKKSRNSIPMVTFQTRKHIHIETHTKSERCVASVCICRTFKIFADALKMKINSINAQPKLIYYMKLDVISHALVRLFVCLQLHRYIRSLNTTNCFSNRLQGRFKQILPIVFKALHTILWFHNFKLSIGIHYSSPKLCIDICIPFYAIQPDDRCFSCNPNHIDRWSHTNQTLLFLLKFLFFFPIDSL